jgi:hypothetical protein
MKVLLFSLLVSHAPVKKDSVILPSSPAEEVKAVIVLLFQSMEKGDSTTLGSLFHASARLQTISNRRGEVFLSDESITSFKQIVATPHPEPYLEKVISWKIDVEDELAAVWTPYEFYVGKKFSHCGVNAFQLMKTAQGWKIIQITDTRKNECGLSAGQMGKTEERKSPAEREIRLLLDQWHFAAAKGDEDFFFGLMDEDFIYLGTDKTERWDKKTFWGFAKKYFEREGGAWNFKAVSRQLYFTDDLQYAWFEENLDTWMGVCRGSGVLQFKREHGWKLKHYNLSVTIDNDKINQFIAIDPN